ncbi:hypothetical protein MPCS_00065 [Candidatus Megaera polyxenophila]|jgi:hypothetical protein|nr:hypothetical protein MPCS_00065 [Candidatus Megaera polyxenophila]
MKPPMIPLIMMIKVPLTIIINSTSFGRGTFKTPRKYKVNCKYRSF